MRDDVCRFGGDRRDGFGPAAISPQAGGFATAGLWLWSDVCNELSNAGGALVNPAKYAVDDSRSVGWLCDDIKHNQRDQSPFDSVTHRILPGGLPTARHGRRFTARAVSGSGVITAKQPPGYSKLYQLMWVRG